MPKKISENNKIEILDSYLENLLLLDLKITDEEFCKKNNISRSLLNKWLNEFGGKELFKRKYFELSKDGKLHLFKVFENFGSLKFSWFLLMGVTLYLFALWAVLYFLIDYYFGAVIIFSFLLILYFFVMYFFLRRKFF
tara:strand:- start:38 stop:451 length:414 start_codon:yes stop_codon:yes gene_type:complete